MTELKTGREYFIENAKIVEPEFWFFIFNALTKIEKNDGADLTEFEMHSALAHFLWMEEIGVDNEDEYIYSTLKRFFIG
jgi:hypothetical protein